MNWLQLRFSSGPDDTLGAVFMVSPGPAAMAANDPTFRCFSLEDEKRVIKVSGETRIPPGRYEIKKRHGSPKFGYYDTKFAPWHRGMLHLLDVPGFDWIYIHPGNTEAHTAGCILVGDGAMENITKNGRLINSVSAYERIYKEIDEALNDGQRVFWEVRDAA